MNRFVKFTGQVTRADARSRFRRPTTPARRVALAAVISVLLAAPAGAGQGAPGLEQQRPEVYAITGATVITGPGTTIEGATLVLRNGLIEAVGADVAAPADAELVDGSGMTVWPGFIDAYTTVALQPETPEPQGGQGGGGRRGAAPAEPEEPGTGHPIERVHPELDVTEHLVAGDNDVERYRNAGFTAALVVPPDGIYRGRSAVITLAEGAPRSLVVRADVAQAVGFQSGGFGGGYPGSLMGVIATIRQVLLDAQRWATWTDRWERDPAGMQRPEQNDAFPPLQAVLAGEQPVIFDTPNARSVERVIRIAAEFGLRPIIKGTGTEYQVVDLLAEAQMPVITPVDYPDGPDVGDDEENLDVSLESLQEWQQAPGNAAALEQAGVRFALTAFDLANPGQFAANVRKAIEAGLSEETALASVTTVPAALLGIDAMLGTIEAGKIANVVLASGPPFGEDTRIERVWVDGRPYEVEAGGNGARGGGDGGPADPRGTWAVTMGAGDMSMESTWIIQGNDGNYTGRASSQAGIMDFTRVELDGDALTVVAFAEGMGEMEITVRVEGDRLWGNMSLGEFTMDISGRRTSGPGMLGAHGGPQ